MNFVELNAHRTMTPKPGYEPNRDFCISLHPYNVNMLLLAFSVQSHRAASMAVVLFIFY